MNLNGNFKRDSKRIPDSGPESIQESSGSKPSPREHGVEIIWCCVDNNHLSDGIGQLEPTVKTT